MTTGLLGGLWFLFCGWILSKLLERNWDLKIALGLSALVFFAPALHSDYFYCPLNRAITSLLCLASLQQLLGATSQHFLTFESFVLSRLSFSVTPHASPRRQCFFGCPISRFNLRSELWIAVVDKKSPPRRLSCYDG